MQKVDIAIVGAGLNGLVAGVALASIKGLTVAIIDQTDPTRFASPAHDSRTSALTLATQTMLSTLDLWQSIESHAQTVKDIIVTDSDDGQFSWHLTNLKDHLVPRKYVQQSAKACKTLFLPRMSFLFPWPTEVRVPAPCLPNLLAELL